MSNITIYVLYIYYIYTILMIIINNLICINAYISCIKYINNIL